MKIKIFNIAFFIALGLTLFSTGLSYKFLSFRNENESARDRNFFYEGLESTDHKYTDFIFKLRGQRPTQAPVALIAIDDESVREVGRWPWNRDLMAQITKNLTNLGVGAVGFDVIQSEPDNDHPDFDEKLAQAIANSGDRIVLGTFSENESKYKSYQDYCVAEAFLQNGGDRIVNQENTTISMDGPESRFDGLKWGGLFKVLFANVRELSKMRTLKSLDKTQVEQLSKYQKNYLESNLGKSLYDYCKVWLTHEDPFQWKESEPLKKLYADFFSATPGLQGKSLDDQLHALTTEVPFNVVPQSIEWTQNIPSIQNNSKYTASFNAYQDPDGYVRRYPLFYRTGQRLGTSFIPSLALQTYLVAKKYRAEIEFKATGLTKSVSSVKILNPNTNPESLVAELPVDPMGRMVINYYGRQMSLPYVSIKELLTDDPNMQIRRSVTNRESNQLRIETETVSKADFFKNRAVIVGATAVGIYDLRSTPLEPNYPGPEIHLSILANLLDSGWMIRQSNEITKLVGLLLVVGTFLSLAWAHLGALSSVLVFFAAMGANIVFDYFSFNNKNLQTTNVLLLLEVGLLYSTVMIYKYFTEERKKKELKSTFSKYVSPAIVDEILQQPENLKLGGRKQRMSVFFSDIRDFTTISEKLPPVELAQLLNDYLTPMTELVFKNKGTLDKYMGDAVMAFFGAPIFYENHAQMACRCALESLKRVDELAKEFVAHNRPMIRIGIGINTGEMSVGNMGSNIVQNYTVMGDSVNLASRLEGINKEYGTRVIISEFTFNDVKDLFVCREVDRVRVKGKNEPVRIYELIKEGVMDVTESAWLEEYNRGLQLYFKKEFSEAIKSFEKCRALRSSDEVSEVYVERCQEFLSEAPPENWDGVFVMKTK